VTDHRRSGVRAIRPIATSILLATAVAGSSACGGGDGGPDPGSTPMTDDATSMHDESTSADGDDESTGSTSTSSDTLDPTEDDGTTALPGEVDTGNGTNDSGGPCPVPFGTLDCATTCDLFVWECESCPMRPGDLCTYYPYQLDACLTGCAGLTDPSDFTYEVFACRQAVGMVCDEDAVVQCLLEIDCA